MDRIVNQFQGVQKRAQKAAFERILINRGIPRVIRRRAIRSVSGFFRLTAKAGAEPTADEFKVERSWRPAPSNEPGEKRIGAIRRRYPKNVEFYREGLYDKVYYYLEREIEFISGRWTEHWGDASLYGPAADVLRWRMTGDIRAFERAMSSRRANLRDIRQVREDPRKLMGGAENAMMAAMGLIVTFDYLPHWETVPEALGLIEMLDDLMEALGGYLEGELPITMADYYGRTTPTAMFFMMNLVVADFMKRHDRSITGDTWVGNALRFLDAARKKAYDFEGPRFLFNPGEERHFCCPNPVFALGLTLLHSITGQSSALQEAEGIFNWLYKNLRDEQSGGYWTPYVSMLRRGEYSLNIKSLSAQNYMLLVSLYLYEATGNDTYLWEIKSLLDFIERDLYYGGLIWHEVEDGKRADLTTPEPYCVGCNLMTLYILSEINYTCGLGDKLMELEGEKPSRKGRRKAPAEAVAGRRVAGIESVPEEEDIF